MQYDSQEPTRKNILNVLPDTLKMMERHGHSPKNSIFSMESPLNEKKNLRNQTHLSENMEIESIDYNNIFNELNQIQKIIEEKFNKITNSLYRLGERVKQIEKKIHCF